MANDVCAHTACGCKVPPGTKFCSSECERAGDETDCSCGHPDCQARA